MKNITPTGKRLLVEKHVEKETVTPAGIIVPTGLTYDNSSNTIEHLKPIEEEQEPEAYTAKVLSIGPDVTVTSPNRLVLVGKYAGIDIFKDKTSVIINETDVLATID